MKRLKKYLFNTPLLALIAANVVPLFGAVFWDWETFNILFLYWAENLAVGLYTILKLVFFPVPDPAKRLSLGAFLVKTCFIVPFTIHYGGFVAAHCLVIMTFFRNENAGSVMSLHMIGALVALFLSHGVSFVRNYLIGGEYASFDLAKVMIFGPYSRVAVMSIAVFVGGWGVVMLGSPLGGLVALIVLKTAIDAISHLREHKKAKPRALRRARSRVNKSRSSGGTATAGKEVLVVASKVKTYIKSRNMIASSDAIAALSDRVRAILDKAVARAKANHRSTVKPHDL